MQLREKQREKDIKSQ